MGIFADKCRALIDPETGRALSGDALKEARAEKKWPRCNTVVRKAARFCNTCGSAAPKGWWTCPHCKKRVGNDSEYCWNCNAKLHPESRVDIAGGVWDKDAAVFAQRFELGDINKMLKKGLQVQAGSLALLLDGGKYKGRLDAGVHNPDSLARAINHFGTPPPRSAVLVDAGDVILPVRVEELRSSEGMPLEFYGEIILRFNPKQAQTFLENRLKDGLRLTYEDLSDLLQGDIRHAVDSLCATSTIDDLVRDPERRIRLQDEMASTLKVTLERSGLCLVHISSAEFCGDEYEALQEKRGDVEQKRREVEYDQQLREALSKDAMDTFKSEQDVKDYQEMLAHEYQISSLQREREEEVLVRGWKHRDQLEDLRKEMEGRKVQDDYERGKQVSDAETAAEARDKTFGQEAKETEQALKWRKQKNEMKQQDLEAEAKVMSGKSMEEMIALCDDPLRREELLRLHQQQVQAGLSEKELMAQAKLESLEEQKKMTEAGAERLERVMRDALKAMGEAAKGGNTTIHK